MKTETVVLGAGIVGVCTAIHLSRRGKSVALVDKRGAGEETSYGNAGLIQREGVWPRRFPRDPRELFRYGLNRSIEAHYHLSALPRFIPFLLRYWWHSEPRRYERIVRHYAPLIEHSVSEHADLIAASGAGELIRKDGWITIYRTRPSVDEGYALADRLSADFGIGHNKLGGADLARMEPALRSTLAGGVHWLDPWTIRDPNRLIRAYLAYFKSLGGRVLKGDAETLEPVEGPHNWRLRTEEGPIAAEDAIVALGPWSDVLTTKLGYRLPLAIKRGYHMHYENEGEARVHNFMLDAEAGYVIAPMLRGLRLTTGAEFARLDAPKTPVQLARAENAARELFPLGRRLDDEPWMGARPCTPDMMPIIGRAPRHAGLWFAFGHAHHGMTLGAVTGRALAEAITGEKTVIDLTPYRAERFGS